MHPQFEKVSLQNSPFLIKEETFSFFNIPWHIHPEFELTLIAKGKGKLYVGDNICDFKERDLILTGPNLPHCWISSHLGKNNPLQARQIVLQFSSHFLGEDFLNYQIFNSIKQLLNLSSRGIMFRGNVQKEAAKKITAMLNMDVFDQIIALLELLHSFATCNDAQVLSSVGFSGISNEADSERMNKIYKFIIDHYKRKINLHDISSFANMTPPAFCKYFKKRTRKTFAHFLNEVRIGNACRLLIEQNLNASQACYESGFLNLSNFNRQFKKITKTSPLLYQKQYSKH